MKKYKPRRGKRSTNDLRKIVQAAETEVGRIFTQNRTFRESLVKEINNLNTMLARNNVGALKQRRIGDSTVTYELVINKRSPGIAIKEKKAILSKMRTIVGTTQLIKQNNKDLANRLEFIKTVAANKWPREESTRIINERIMDAKRSAAELSPVIQGLQKLLETIGKW